MHPLVLRGAPDDVELAAAVAVLTLASGPIPEPRPAVADPGWSAALGYLPPGSWTARR